MKPPLASSFISPDFHFLKLMKIFFIIFVCLFIYLKSLFFSRPHVPQIHAKKNGREFGRTFKL